jgi:hypothetical protein
MSPSFAFPFVFVLVFFAVMAIKMYREWKTAAGDLPKKLTICVSGVCVLAFVEPFWINVFPSKVLDHIELPNSPTADRLTAPDGRVFVVSPAIARVQRYGPDGFEMGFLYGRKAFTFRMSPSGNILICATGGELLTYSPDGTEVPPRGSCKDQIAASWSSYPSRAKVPTIAFNWLSVIAVPFWHPVAAWLTALLTGLFYLGFRRRPT